MADQLEQDIDPESHEQRLEQASHFYSVYSAVLINGTSSSRTGFNQRGRPLPIMLNFSETQRLLFERAKNILKESDASVPHDF